MGISRFRRSLPSLSTDSFLWDVAATSNQGRAYLSVLGFTYLKLKGIMPVEVPKTNPSFLNGVPELLVLQLLARRDMYGYEIVKAIQTSSREAFAFGEGCVYPVLHELEARKCVISRRADVDGRSRLYYALTAAGRKRLESLTHDWEQVAIGVKAVLKGTHA